MGRLRIAHLRAAKWHETRRADADIKKNYSKLKKNKPNERKNNNNISRACIRGGLQTPGPVPCLKREFKATRGVMSLSALSYRISSEHQRQCIPQCDLNRKKLRRKRRSAFNEAPTHNEGRLRSRLIGIMSRVLHGSHLLIQYAAVLTRTPGNINEFCQTSSDSPR